MAEVYLDRNSDLKTIEGNVKNKFKWTWLEEKDSNGDFLSDYVRKIPVAGLCYCLFCKARLNYGSKGKSFLFRHAQSKHHIVRRNELRSNHSLPAVFQGIRNLEQGCSAESSSNLTRSTTPSNPYGLAPNVPRVTNTAPCVAPPPACPPSLKDRISHQEAIICSFIAEHSLPLSMAPHLISLAQLLAQDHKALQSLSMERQTATYKLKFGLKEIQRKRLVNKLKSNFFSLNLDESTTKHGKKRVLNILVCFFDEGLHRSVTHLYSSVELFTVNADTVYHAVRDSLVKDNIPLTNMVSVLSDSAAYMRGCNNGFFVKLKEDAPHLIDIDGDICHHVHNICKLFTSSLDPDNHVSSLCDDIHKDFEYSADLRHEFSSICSSLSAKFLLPKERVGHRWLNILDCLERISTLKDGLCVFYFSFLSQSDKELFQCHVTEIFQRKNVDNENRQTMFRVMKKVKSKNMTSQGKARKQRICKKLFDFKIKTDVLNDTLLTILPMFKRFVLLFEQKTPQIHVIHDEQINIFKQFIQFFVKPEFIREEGKDLYNLDLTRDDILLPARHVYVGSSNSQATFGKLPKPDADSFKGKLLHAYKTTGIYMQKKLPLNNPVLRTMSFLDPRAFGQAATAISLKKLTKYLPTIQDRAPNFDLEIMAMQSDLDIAPDSEQLDVWWSKVFRLNRYPSVKKVISAYLSVFTGPRVEQSFSLMNSIICDNTASLLISTYEAYMFTKYQLLASEKTTLELYRRTDPVTSPVDSSLAYHMQTAAARQKSGCQKKRPQDTPHTQSQEKKRKLSLSPLTVKEHDKLSNSL